LEELKKTLAHHLRTRKYSLVIEGKIYTSEELAEEVENDTPLGKKLIQMAIRGTIERYMQR